MAGETRANNGKKMLNRIATKSSGVEVTFTALLMPPPYLTIPMVCESWGRLECRAWTKLPKTDDRNGVARNFEPASP
jgi:hypothetical protein